MIFYAGYLIKNQNQNQNQNGNALFLILIAVALFAALSYAVTQSGRGGGNIDREQGEIYAARLISQIGTYHQTMQRLKLGGGFDQVHFNDSAPNYSGTCYNGGQTTSPCYTIGLFHESTGVSAPPAERTGDHWWTWQMTTMRLRVGGAEVGTPAPDTYFYVASVSEATCRALNRRLNDVGDFLSANTTLPGSGPGFVSFGYWPDDDEFDVSSNPTFAGFDYAAKAGCMDQGSFYSFFYTMEER